ncbi:C-terminal binding protein [Bengtsoniella intestinalis]|uniref:C-terminal binding protein n=1 Tax=Bengtsoniella intestinalis TaxID=3073143 RepID=UPI00391F3DDF
MAKFKVAVSDTRHASYAIEEAILNTIDAEVVYCNCVTDDDIIAQCADADAIFLDLAPFTAKVAAALPKCKVVNRYGVGFENVDIAACTAAGIQVTNVPDYCMEDVSDHALALMMSCLRHVGMRDRKIREGAWNLQGTSFRLKGKTLGVIGAGRIARSLIQKVSGFDLKEVVAFDPYLTAEQLAEFGVRKVEMAELLSTSDFISLHLHVNEETRGIINKEKLDMMKPTAILINVSRGPLVNDADLLDALQNNRILAAGLDTHCCEPLGANSPYCALDNVVLTDHTAYSTAEGVEELKTKSAKNIAAVLTGQAPAYPINQLS